MLYDTTFLLFSAMLYDVVFVWPPHASLLYSVVLARGQQKQFSRHISLLNRPREISFANFVSCVLEIFVFGCPFLLFLVCARLLVL